ncbi:MAG TPA: ornithine cyclodeaminase family protein [Terriglobales bacterium]|nr:ornithine cyclodeaminase family protein [Terriglobales bacterium]
MSTPSKSVPSIGPLLLSRSDVAAFLAMPDCIQAVEEAFQLFGEGKTGKPGVLGVHGEGGGFHIKAAIYSDAKPYFVMKVNGNFPGNPSKHNLPTIQGVLVLADARNGTPLAIMDSAEITNLRTGAATGVAAKYLARKDSSTALIIGCGVQAKTQLQAVQSALPLRKVFAYGIDHVQAKQFAERMSRELKIEVEAVADFRSVIAKCDICVTCTTSQKWFLGKDDVPDGMFVAAVGADNEHKQELQPELFARAKVVTDVTDQCAVMGDLHHALESGACTRDDVYAELGEVVAGRKPGRTSATEITIFDSTGMALQDVASAIRVYEAALATPSARHFSIAT